MDGKGVQHPGGHGGVRPSPGPNAWRDNSIGRNWGQVSSGQVPSVKQGDQRPPGGSAGHINLQQRPSGSVIAAGNVISQRPDLMAAQPQSNVVRPSVGSHSIQSHGSEANTKNSGMPRESPVKSGMQPSSGPAKPNLLTKDLEQTNVPQTGLIASGMYSNMPMALAIGQGAEGTIKTESADEVIGRIATMNNDGDIAMKHVSVVRGGSVDSSGTTTKPTVVVKKDDFVSMIVSAAPVAAAEPHRRVVTASNSLGGDISVKTDSQLASQQGSNSNRAANSGVSGANKEKKWEEFELDNAHHVEDGSLGVDKGFSTTDMFKMNRERGFKIEEYKPELYMMSVDKSHGNYDERYRQAERMRKAMEAGEARHRRMEDEADDSMYSDVHTVAPVSAGGAGGGGAISNNWREGPSHVNTAVPLQAQQLDRPRQSLDLGSSRNMQLMDDVKNTRYQQQQQQQQQQQRCPPPQQQQHDRTFHPKNDAGPRRSVNNNNNSNNNMNSAKMNDYRVSNDRPSNQTTGNNNNNSYGSGNRPLPPSGVVSNQQQHAPVSNAAPRPSAWGQPGGLPPHQQQQQQREQQAVPQAQQQQSLMQLPSASGPACVSPQQRAVPGFGNEGANEKDRFSHVSLANRNLPSTPSTHQDVTSPTAAPPATTNASIMHVPGPGQVPQQSIPNMPYGQTAEQRKMSMMSDHAKRMQHQQQPSPHQQSGSQPANLVTYAGASAAQSQQQHDQPSVAAVTNFPPMPFQQYVPVSTMPQQRFDNSYAHNNSASNTRHNMPHPTYNNNNNNNNNHRNRAVEASGMNNNNNNNRRVMQPHQAGFHQQIGQPHMSYQQQHQQPHYQQQLQRDMSPRHDGEKKLYPGRTATSKPPPLRQQESVTASSTASVKSSAASSPSSQTTTTSTRAGGDSALPPSSTTGSPNRHSTNMTSDCDTNSVSDFAMPSTFGSKAFDDTKWVLDAPEFVPPSAPVTVMTVSVPQTSSNTAVPAADVTDPSGTNSPPSVAGGADKSSAAVNPGKNNSSTGTPTRVTAIQARAPLTSTSSTASTSTSRSSPPQSSTNGRRDSTASSGNNGGSKTPQYASTVASPSNISNSNTPPHIVTNFQQVHMHQQQQQRSQVPPPPPVFPARHANGSRDGTPGTATPGKSSQNMNKNDAADNQNIAPATLPQQQQHQISYQQQHHAAPYNNNNRNGPRNSSAQQHQAASPGGHHQGRPNFQNRVPYPPPNNGNNSYQQHPSGNNGNISSHVSPSMPQMQQHFGGNGGGIPVVGGPQQQLVLQSSPPAGGAGYGIGGPQVFPMPQQAYGSSVQAFHAMTNAVQNITLQLQTQQQQPHAMAFHMPQQQFTHEQIALMQAAAFQSAAVNVTAQQAALGQSAFAGGNGGAGGMIGYPQHVYSQMLLAQHQQHLQQQHQQHQQQQHNLYNNAVVANQLSFIPQRHQSQYPQRAIFVPNANAPPPLSGMMGTALSFAGHVPPPPPPPQLQQHPGGGMRGAPPSGFSVPQVHMQPANNNGNGGGNNGSPHFVNVVVPTSSYPVN